ncbi:MAG: YcxB family protein [Tissierellia bacterium]|nr:YcxB family protein [Tissierellia bacterium]
MKIEYEINAEDLIQFNLFHLEMDKRAQKAFRLQTGVPLIIFFIYLVFKYIKQSVSFFKGVLIFLIVTILWTVIYRKVFKKIIELKMRKILKSQTNNNNFGIKSMEFHDKYLMETTKGRKKKLFYKNVFRAVETKDYIYIYEGPGIAYTLPKKYLTEDQLKEIKNKLGMKSVFKKSLDNNS